MSEDLEYINSKCYVSYLHKCTKYRLCGYQNNVYLFNFFLSLFLFLAKCFLLLTPLQSPVSDPLQGFLLLYMLSTSPPFMDGVGG